MGTSHCMNREREGDVTLFPTYLGRGPQIHEGGRELLQGVALQQDGGQVAAGVVHRRRQVQLQPPQTIPTGVQPHQVGEELQQVPVQRVNRD